MNKRLVELRFNQGLSPAALGEKVGVSAPTIRRVESGEQPTAAVAKKLADHFGLTPIDLFPLTVVPDDDGNPKAAA